MKNDFLICLAPANHRIKKLIKYFVQMLAVGWIIDFIKCLSKPFFYELLSAKIQNTIEDLLYSQLQTFNEVMALSVCLQKIGKLE